jgi:mannosyltransferase
MKIYIRKIIDNKKDDKIILLAIILAALILQLYHLGYKGLWLDEAISFQISSSSLQKILSSPDDVHPSLYYVILHAFLYLGKSEFYLRLPSVIFSVATIPLVYRLGKDLFDSRVGLLSAFLLAFSPTIYWFAQEARMYTLFMFLSLLSLSFFYNSLSNNDNKSWIGFIASNFLNMYTHYFAFITIFIEIIYVFLFIKKYRPILRKFMICLLINFALFIPQFLNLYAGIQGKLGGGATWGLKPTILFLPNAFYVLSAGNFSSSLIFGIPLFILFLYGLYSSEKTNREACVLSAIWVFVPTFVLYSLAFKINVEFKYIIFILPVYLIIAAKGLLNINIKRTHLAIALIFIIFVFNAYFIYENYNIQKEQWNYDASYIERNILEKDIVLAIPSVTEMCFWYYGLDPDKVFSMDLNFGDEFVAKVNALALENPRIWIPYTAYTLAADDEKHLLNWLNNNSIEKFESEIGYDKIFLYEYNSSLNFYYTSEKGDIAKNLGSGWYDLENWGGMPTRWMQDKAIFFADSSIARNSQISFQAQSFRKSRVLEIYVNDILANRTEISPGMSSIKLLIPLKKGLNKVKFSSQDGCERPSNVGEIQNADRRCLSFAFQNISLKPIEIEPI